MLLDRQAHAWPTATKAADTKLPTVVFAPLGAAFTTNTAPLAKREGLFISSTDDFGEAVYGLKMLRAAAILREMRVLVIRGGERKESVLQPFGTKLLTIPATDFVAEYNKQPVTDELRKIASDYIYYAKSVHGPSQDDVLNGVRSFAVARTLLEREAADSITMDCLGALGKTKISLPCIAWSRMLDHGIPAACEADLGACVTHTLVQLLFDRPGFQQDPVADTARGCLIGAHCSCATRLNGLDQPAEPFVLSHHHGKRDAVPRTLWRAGQRVTVADVLLAGQGQPTQMVISAGTVIDNVSVPPAGGCVVSVRVELDGVTELLDYPGFHQLFFYGDYKRQLAAYCQLTGITPVMV
jgi:hypothetical protein